MSTRSEVVFSFAGNPDAVSDFHSVLAFVSRTDMGSAFLELFSPESKYWEWSKESETDWRCRWNCQSVKWDFEVEREFAKLVLLAKVMGLSGCMALSCSGKISEVSGHIFGAAPPEEDVDYLEQLDQGDDAGDESFEEWIQVVPGWESGVFPLCEFGPTETGAILSGGDMEIADVEDVIEKLVCVGDSFGEPVKVELLKDGVLPSELQRNVALKWSGDREKTSPRLSSLIEAVLLKNDQGKSSRHHEPSV